MRLRGAATVVLLCLLFLALLQSPVFAHSESAHAHGESAPAPTVPVPAPASSAQPAIHQAAEPHGHSHGLSVDIGLTPRDAADLVVRAIHMIAAITWIGGMVFFLIVLRPMAGTSSAHRDKILFHGYRRFGNLAAISVGLLLASGIYNLIFGLPNSTGGLQGGIASTGTLLEVPFGEAYAQLLAAKLSLVAIMFAGAAISRWVFVPKLGSAIAVDQPDEAARHSKSLLLLSSLNLGAGAVVATITVVLLYVHMLSHAAAAG